MKVGCELIELSDIKEHTFGGCRDEKPIRTELHHVGKNGNGSEHGTVSGGEGLKREPPADYCTASVSRVGDREVQASLVIDHPELIFDDSHVIKDRLNGYLTPVR